jgi:acylphosphatase
VSDSRLEVVVRGVVQGVGFRYFARQEAARLGVVGWVANRADGAVDVVAEGDRATLDELLDRLAVGPPGSVVRDVDVAWRDATGGFRDFGVRAGGHSGD